MTFLKTFLFVVISSLATIANAQYSPAISIILKASGMQYDQVRFSVRPGSRIKITLINGDDMSHNLVITKPGARLQVVEAALKLGEAGSKVDFVPASSEVLWSIPLLAPGQTESITITAPTVAGVYPYVCTYPGHGYIMYGAMYVGVPTLPALKDDQNIPESRRKDQEVTKHSMHALQEGHPYPLIPPYLFRAFLPDTGPDAIAVRLPKNLSYCWDAGTCRLRYAWKGDFLDFTDFWKSYKRYSVKVMGAIFYRDKTYFPLRFSATDSPAVVFKGYRLVNRYPEFHYTADETDVYELIKAKADGTGLIRSFKIPKATKPLAFTFDSNDGVTYTSLKGKMEKGKLLLSAAEARNFTIIMTEKRGGKQ